MKKSIAILTILLAAFYGRAQSAYYDDAQLRTHLLVEKKFGSHFSMSLEQQNRWTQNVSEYARGSADLGLNWKFNKHFKISADYIYIQKRLKDLNFSARHWFNFSVHLRNELHRWKFFYRGMLQARSADIEEEGFNRMRIYNRNKITARYEITKRVGLTVAGEAYIPINSPQAKGIDRTRTIGSITYKTSRYQQLELYFMYQVQMQKNNWFEQKDRYDNGPLRRQYIYGISYAIVIP